MSDPAKIETELPPEARVAQLLATLWQRNQDQVSDRLELLERAASDLLAGRLAPELRRESIAVAHNLSGTLGMFGFPQGTEFARSLEQQLNGEIPDAQLCSTLVVELRTTLFPARSAAQL